MTTQFELFAAQLTNHVSPVTFESLAAVTDIVKIKDRYSREIEIIEQYGIDTYPVSEEAKAAYRM